MIEEEQKGTGFNIFTTLITKAILLLGGFLTSILLARLLGVEGKGALVALFVIPSLVVSLANLGIRQATAYFVGIRKYKIEDIVSSVGFLWFLTSAISFAVVAVFFYVGYRQEYSYYLLLIVLLTVPINLLTEYSMGIMQGKGKISKINILQIVKFIANLCGILIFVWLLKLDVLGATIGIIATAIITAGFYVYDLSKSTKIKIKCVGNIPIKLFLKGITFALALFILNLNYRLDIVFLEYYLSSSDVGIYSVGVGIAELVWQIPAAIGFVVFSKNVSSISKCESVNRAIRLLRISIPLLFLICAFLYFIIPYFIPFAYGDAFSKSVEVTQLLLPGVLFMTIIKILHPDLAARGNPLYAIWAYVTAVLLNIILNISLIPNYGVYGAAFASTVSYMIASFLFIILYSKKENKSISDLLVIKKEDLNIIYSNMKKVYCKIKFK